MESNYRTAFDYFKMKAKQSIDKAVLYCEQIKNGEKQDRERKITGILNAENNLAKFHAYADLMDSICGTGGGSMVGEWCEFMDSTREDANYILDTIEKIYQL